MQLEKTVIRVLIADDQPRARHSLQALLTAMRWSHDNRDMSGAGQIETVGEAIDGQGAIDQVELLNPDVILIELQMPGLDSLTAISAIKRRWPEVKIVVLTMYATERAAALASGADAFLLKGCPTGELLEAVLVGRSSR
jgi:hemolysin D